MAVGVLLLPMGCCEFRCEFLAIRGPEGPLNLNADAQDSA